MIFADESTGALDPTTGGAILRLLRDAVDRDRVTVVMVSHDKGAAAWSDRLVLLRDGGIVADTPTPDAETIAARLRAVSADAVQAASPGALQTASNDGLRAASAGIRRAAAW